MKRKRMIKLLMAMGYKRNWANEFARLFQGWPFLVSYAEYQEMLEDPYEYMGVKAWQLLGGRVPSIQELGIEVPAASHYEPDWSMWDTTGIPDSYGKLNPYRPNATAGHRNHWELGVW